MGKAIESIGAYILLIMEVIWVSVRSPPKWALIRDQLLSVGILSLPVVAITGFSTGMVLAAQSFFQLSDKGLADATGIMVAKAMLVEIGPVLTAFMITGRVGSAMCAELGTMRVSEQIDALRSMAVNPANYLVAPRFIAGTIMMPLLTVFSCMVGIIGGYIIAVYYYGMSPTTFTEPIPIHVKRYDLLMAIVKSFVFGMLIVTICCYKGMTTTGGAAGVGRSTTNSVVISYSMILFSNFILTLLLNSLYTYFTHSFGG